MNTAKIIDTLAHNQATRIARANDRIALLETLKAETADTFASLHRQIDDTAEYFTQKIADMIGREQAELMSLGPAANRLVTVEEEVTRRHVAMNGDAELAALRLRP